MEAFFPLAEKKHSTYLLLIHTSSSSSLSPSRAEPCLAATGRAGARRPSPAPRGHRAQGGVANTVLTASPGEEREGSGGAAAAPGAVSHQSGVARERYSLQSGITTSRRSASESRGNQASAEAELLLEGVGVGRRL